MAGNGSECCETPIVEDEQLYAAARPQQVDVTTIAAGEREVGEELGNALVEDGAVVTTALWPSAQASQLFPTPVGPHRIKFS